MPLADALPMLLEPTRSRKPSRPRVTFRQRGWTGWHALFALGLLAVAPACSKPPPVPQSVARMSLLPLGAPDLADPNGASAAKSKTFAAGRTPVSPRHVAAAPSVDAPTTPGKIEDPSGHALDAFYDGLARAEAGASDGRVAIVQFGDSHTAGDSFTGRLRHVLQKKFGDAGRGFLLPGLPFAGYMAEDAIYGSTGAWHAENGLYRTSHGPFGMAGFRVHADAPNAIAWVGTCATCETGRSASRIAVLYRKAAGAGQLAIQVDGGEWQLVDTAADDTSSAAPGMFSLELTDAQHKVAVRPAGNGAVDVIGMVLERDQPGVIVDSLGVVSARAAHIESWDWRDLGAQLATRDPRLVIFAYGTNEIDMGTSPAQLEAQLVTLIARARKAAPQASILVLGPPDMAKYAFGAWRTPSNLQPLVAAERRAAFRGGAAFFDVYGAMGGANHIDRFHAEGLASRDRVHLTDRGYQAAADLLLAQLLHDYAQR